MIKRSWFIISVAINIFLVILSWRDERDLPNVKYIKSHPLDTMWSEDSVYIVKHKIDTVYYDTDTTETSDHQ